MWTPHSDPQPGTKPSPRKYKTWTPGGPWIRDPCFVLTWKISNSEVLEVLTEPCNVFIPAMLLSNKAISNLVPIKEHRMRKKSSLAVVARDHNLGRS